MRDHKQKHPLDDEYSLAPIVPLSSLDCSWLAIVGGKAANLGELIQAGFNVPEGFCLTTAVSVDLSSRAQLDPLLRELTEIPADELERLASLAQQIRAALLNTPLPTDVIEAVTSAYHALGDGEAVPVAVRSSANAEDLPGASFAGQQETALNVRGIEAVVAAIRHCFASLWTDRAVIYRARQGIDPRTVQLAVVVQRLVEAAVAGVLFTANPLNGNRHQTVINANPGLGEAVVAGATNPDQFVVHSATGEIVERHLGDKQVLIQALAAGGTQKREIDPSPSLACLSDDQIQALTALGSRVAAHYKAPQDIEWALDASGQLFLLQARPITTLFPLPAPASDEEIRAYMAFGVQQGTFQPFTPMGLSALRLLASVVVTLMGQAPPDPLKGPRFVMEAAARPFFDVTAALRSSLGRSFLARGMEQAEVHAFLIFQQLAEDARFSLLPTPRMALLRSIALFLVQTRMPLHLLSALLWPGRSIVRVERLVQALREGPGDPPTEAEACLEAVELLCFETFPRLLRTAPPAMVAGMLSFEMAQKLLGKSASTSELQVVLRGTASNPTTEMTRALWTLAQELRGDSATAQILQQTSATQLATDYHKGHLPALLQRGLSHFLASYGERCVNELDLGVARWSEDPTYVLGLLASYQQMQESGHVPEEQYQHAQDAKTMIATLSHRASSKSWIRGRLVTFMLKRAQMLAGMREMPRFCGNLLLVQVRRLIWKVGEEMTQAGRLRSVGDIFFLTLPEAREALAGSDMQELVEERRAIYIQEQARRHVPLILLSDGTEPSPTPLAGEVAGRMQGTPASPGNVSALARVLFDPHEAELLPGEILVAPSTDPGWTPLFLKAAGLVMETGGAMAHGAIVAREYGIPAVVAVQGATRRIKTGSRITVNGTDGTVLLEDA